MKTLRFLILGFLTATIVCHAQVITNSGWFLVDCPDFSTLTNETTDSESSWAQPKFSSMGVPAPPNIAEAITPEIQELADGLQHDPVKIYNYVHDHIRYILYFGSKKGAQLTLLEKSGNDFDQCALLVALLKASGFNPNYEFGWMLLPYDNPDGSQRDLRHWLGLSMDNTNWVTTSAYLNYLFKSLRFYPADAYNFDNNTFAFQRVWVTLPIAGTNYYLDPSFKLCQPISNTINLPSATGFNSNTLMSAAGGTLTNNYISGLNEAALRGTLAGYTSNLLGYLQNNYPNASVGQILGGQYIIPSTNIVLSQTLLFPVTNLNGTMPVVSWANQPTNMMYTLSVALRDANCKWSIYTPQLQGQRLSLTVSNNGLAQLWLDDSLMIQTNTGGGSGQFNVTISSYYPVGSWDTNNNTFIRGTFGMSVAKQYQASSANYALLYAYDPDWGWLQKRQQILEAYRQQGLSDTSRQVLTETLNIMGLNWQLQVGSTANLLASQQNVLPHYALRMGRMGQESGFGYYIDVYMTALNVISSSTQSWNDTTAKWVDVLSYFGSAMEHGMIEQLQSTNLVGASTVKMLQLANTNSQAVYLANSTNWSTIQSSLTGYSASTLNNINSAFISQGYSVLLPQNGSIQLAGSGSWTGFGLLCRKSGGSGNVSMIIGDSSGIHYGGYVSSLNASVNPYSINYYGYSQPQYYCSVPAFTYNPFGADPVNMADGTFQLESEDMTLGQAEPRGLKLGHYYSSSRRNSNLAGMAPGWLHNYFLKTAVISSPQAGLGGTTPAQCASIITAMTAALGVYNPNQADSKNWMVTALIAKWGIDQLTAKAVSVTLGKDTLQFIKQPDGSFTPPANCTMTLTQNGTAYNLQERHGNTFQFNSLGYCTNIVDQYSQSLKLAYNASNWVSTVKDWKNRTMTFNYSGTPSRLASVSDGTRSVSFGYNGSDLTSVTDLEGKTSTFICDTNHQITATYNANNQLVASNIYNSFGRVTSQYTLGDTNKLWQIFWSGWQTVEQDPAGGQRVFIYDDQGRLVGVRDQLGNMTGTYYDGQNHIIATVSPLNETNQFIYDGNNNVIYSVDPLGYTNQFVFDGQNNLIRSVDPRGNPSTFGYNAQFSLTGTTNGAGDWVNYAFNTDGTLHTSTDAGGNATTYGYDNNGSLNSIIYPNSLGSESFVNNTIGDPSSHTDGNGNVTSYYYNARRDLTNTVAPTNITMKVGFDAVGNAASVTDPRGNTSSNTWSATRHLLKTTLPATAQGTPIVTNSYDSRDWLIKTVNPLQQSMLYTNDAAGRLISAADSLQRNLNFGYDAVGRNIARTNAAQEVTSQLFDKRGKLLKLTDGANHFSTRTYDAAGNQIILTNRNGKQWQFQFDGANRLTNTITPLGRSTAVSFNHQGLVAAVKDAANQNTSLDYDGKGRLATRADSIGTTYYGYDANNNRTSVRENGLTNTWNYDAYNHVSSYRDVFGNLIQYRYDANGNLTNLIYPGGKNVYYSYDSNNHLTNVTDWVQRKTSISYDLAGRVTAIIRPNGSYRSIGYDVAGQATNIMEQMSNSLPIAIFKFNWTNSGSMNWEFVAPLPHTTTVPTRTMTYDDDNRLATVNGANVTSDANGNLTFAPLFDNTFGSYAFDGRNRLSNAGGVTNSYDSINNRIGIIIGTNSTLFVVNPNAKIPQVLMRIKGGVTNYYIYGAGLLYQVTELSTSTNTLTYHFDYRGSTVALSEDSGLVTDRNEYSTYGLTTYRTGTNDTPFMFNGRYGVQTDPNGLLYMQARYYNPYLCRFISADPSGFGGGLNHYAYADGNPVSLIDPFGLGAIGGSSFSSWLNQTYSSIGNALMGPVNYGNGGITFNPADSAGGIINYSSIIAQETTRMDVGRIVALTAVSMIPVGRIGEALIGGERSIVAANNELQIGYHATNPENVGSILANGFRESQAGRLGGGGVYVNNTSEGAIAEYMAHNSGGAAPTLLQVQYNPGLNYQISLPTVQSTVGPLPFAADTLTAPSIRLPGTLNTIIRNGTATTLP